MPKGTPKPKLTRIMPLKAIVPGDPPPQVVRGGVASKTREEWGPIMEAVRALGGSPAKIAEAPNAREVVPRLREAYPEFTYVSRTLGDGENPPIGVWARLTTANEPKTSLTEPEIPQ